MLLPSGLAVVPLSYFLTCRYRPAPHPSCFPGVGEESGAELTHAVVELLFTTSIE